MEASSIISSEIPYSSVSRINDVDEVGGHGGDIIL